MYCKLAKLQGVGSEWNGRQLNVSWGWLVDGGFK